MKIIELLPYKRVTYEKKNDIKYVNNVERNFIIKNGYTIRFDCYSAEDIWLRTNGEKEDIIVAYFDLNYIKGVMCKSRGDKVKCFIYVDEDTFAEYKAFNLRNIRLVNLDKFKKAIKSVGEDKLVVLNRELYDKTMEIKNE